MLTKYLVFIKANFFVNIAVVYAVGHREEENINKFRKGAAWCIILLTMSIYIKLHNPFLCLSQGSKYCDRFPFLQNIFLFVMFLLL